MSGISAKVVAHSFNEETYDELYTLEITFPRFILAQVNTHRMLSKNTSSSRAIPSGRMSEVVKTNPVTHKAWQKSHTGMQGTEYFQDSKLLDKTWLEIRDNYVKLADKIDKLGVTKQITNRLLEPFMWTTMVITGSPEGWSNLLDLRLPEYELLHKDELYNFRSRLEAKNYFGDQVIDGFNKSLMEFNELDWLTINKGATEINFSELAERIYEAMSNSKYKKIKAGEWHIPYEDIIDKEEIEIYLEKKKNNKDFYDILVAVSTSLCARVSYTTVGNGAKIDVERMVDLHQMLIDERHDSPLEHCAKAMSAERALGFYRGNYNDLIDEIDKIAYTKDHGWCKNIKGFETYRSLITN